ncbi:hypothetical protein [Gracilibacillus boraciitolerans]|nr:hypothetical protein [Gracilibacillus boraciitolerans]
MGILESNLDNEIIAKQHVVADLQQLEKRSAHYQLIEDYYLASTNLKRLPSGLAFPTDGIERFNQWKEQLLPLQSEQRIIEKNMKEVEQGLNTLSLLSDEERKQLEYVIDLREEMKYLNEKQEGAANKLAEIRKEITDKLLSIQINLTFDELEEISLPFYLEELWTELSKKIEKIELEQRYVENDQASNQNIMNDFEQQIQHESEQLIDSSIIANYKQELVEADLTREQENQQLRFQKWQKQYRQQSKSSMIIFMVGLLISIGFLFLTDWMWGGGIIAFLSFLQYVVMRIYGQVMKKWLAPCTGKIN